jgi:hypothetical protein
VCFGTVARVALRSWSAGGRRVFATRKWQAKEEDTGFVPCVKHKLHGSVKHDNGRAERRYIRHARY